MNTFWTIFTIVLVVVIAALVGLYFAGRKLQKRQAVQEKQMEAAKQTVSILVIDKGKRKLKEAGLPAMVLEQTPKYMRGMKFPVVKAKIGPKVMTLLCDGKIFDSIPVKKTVKATISGIYITNVRAERGGPLEAPKKKKGFLTKIREKAQKTVNESEQLKGKSKKK